MTESKIGSARDRALAEHGRRCQICSGEGQDVEIEVHHINGDPTEEDLDNLLPVCRDCHSKIHSGEIPEWSEKILPRDERMRRVTYLMDPYTQQEIEIIMHTADLSNEKEAIEHAVKEYNNIYDTVQELSNELPDDLIKRTTSSDLLLSESVETVLQQHIESSQLVEEIRKDMAEVVAKNLFGEEMKIPDD